MLELELESFCGSTLWLIIALGTFWHWFVCRYVMFDIVNIVVRAWYLNTRIAISWSIRITDWDYDWLWRSDSLRLIHPLIKRRLTCGLISMIQVMITICNSLYRKFWQHWCLQWLVLLWCLFVVAWLVRILPVSSASSGTAASLRPSSVYPKYHNILTKKK